MSIDQSHYYRQVWYWGGEADLRVNGKKMELTSIPANEWSQVVNDASGFWDEVAKQSARSAKVVEAFKLMMHLQWIKLDILIDNKFRSSTNYSAGFFPFENNDNYILI